MNKIKGTIYFIILFIVVILLSAIILLNMHRVIPDYTRELFLRSNANLDRSLSRQDSDIMYFIRNHIDVSRMYTAARVNIIEEEVENTLILNIINNIMGGNRVLRRGSSIYIIR